MSDQSLPTLGDHERLIQSLYVPGTNVSQIQAVIQKYQRSQRGWTFADELLQSQLPNVRFYGALTFVVKIHNDWGDLDHENVSGLLNRLLYWLIRLVNQGDGALVLRKLCTALVAYFLHPLSRWDSCVKQIICSFALGDIAPPQTLASYASVDETLRKLNKLQVRTILWFSASLAEEASKGTPGSQRT